MIINDFNYCYSTFIILFNISNSLAQSNGFKYYVIRRIPFNTNNLHTVKKSVLFNP